MKKVVFFILIMTVGVNASLAQLRIETAINQGYEWNIFRNPEKLVESSDTLRRSQLWQNSIYNEFLIESDYYRDWGDQRLKISADGGTNLYHQQTQAHKYTYRFLTSYRINYADNKYFELSPEISREQQDGVDRTDPIFTTRLSYHQLEVPLHLDFYLGDRTWLKFETKYRYKVYDEFDDKQTAYSAYYIEAEFKKSWDESGSLNHEFEIKNETRYRDQRITEFATANSPKEFRDREFTKIETGINYTLESNNDTFELEFPVQGTLFYDHPSGHLDYYEIEAGIEFDVIFGRAEISTDLERTIRHFKNFDVRDGENRLRFGYWTGSAELNIALTHRLSFIIEGLLVTRRSNRERLTTAFYREYTTSYIQSGLIIKL